MKKISDIWWIASAGILFGLFLLNVLLGKAALLFEFEPPVQIGDVGEFMVLFAAIICFVIEVLRRESQLPDFNTKPANAAEEESK